MDPGRVLVDGRVCRYCGSKRVECSHTMVIDGASRWRWRCRDCKRILREEDKDLVAPWQRKGRTR
jgi:hypothetical protein